MREHMQNMQVSHLKLGHKEAIFKSSGTSLRVVAAPVACSKDLVALALVLALGVIGSGHAVLVSSVELLLLLLAQLGQLIHLPLVLQLPLFLLCQLLALQQPL